MLAHEPIVARVPFPFRSLGATAIFCKTVFRMRPILAQSGALH